MIRYKIVKIETQSLSHRGQIRANNAVGSTVGSAISVTADESEISWWMGVGHRGWISVGHRGWMSVGHGGWMSEGG